MNNQPLIIKRVFDAPIEKVWDALTKNDQLKKWYFQLPDFQPVVGFEFTFSGGPDEHNIYKHFCKVTEVITRKKLAYSWRYDGYPGTSLVSIELFAEGVKTKLVLTHTGLETFDKANPHFASNNFEEGWNHIIGKSLKEFVEGEMVKG